MSLKKPAKTVSQKTTQFDDLIKRIRPVSEVTESVSVLIYGRAGTGKTTVASSFPKPLLLLDLKEDGTDSVKDVEGVSVLSVTEWEDLENTYWYLKNNPNEWATVVIDTLTGAQGMCVDHVKGKDGRGKDDSMSQRLWGDVSGLLRTLILQYRDLGVEEGLNMVFLAQDRTVAPSEDEEYSDQVMPEVGPALMPSVGKTVSAAVKIVTQTFASERVKTIKGKMERKIQYRARLGAHPYYLTKVRSPKGSKVPDSIVNPTYDKFMQVLRGEVKADGEEQ